METPSVNYCLKIEFSDSEIYCISYSPCSFHHNSPSSSKTLLVQTINIRRKQFVVYFDHTCACVCMVENDEKHWKMMKKYLFHHVHERHTRGLRRQTKKKVCWSAIGREFFCRFRPSERKQKHVFAVQNTQHIIEIIND